MAELPPTPVLQPFSLTDAEMQDAMDNWPIEKPIRAEAKIMPDIDKPNMIRRIVASGIVAWAQRGDRSLSRLILHLLYLYFTGQLQVVSNTHVSRFAPQAPTPSWEDDDDNEAFNIDFGFKEG
jgi:hypothetical protein